MIVEDTYTFSAPREAVWTALLDPDVVAKTMPGSSGIERVGEDRYEGKMRVGIGPIIAARFDVVITLTEKQFPERYQMQVDGRGSFGFTRGTAIVQLTASGASTVMRYQADMVVGGGIAAVGQRLLDSVSRRLLRQGLDAMSVELARRLDQRPP
jgi:carbon monoxide dehydrogenase subunit G